MFKLLSKKELVKLNENWMNPVLSGETLNNPIINPDLNNPGIIPTNQCDIYDLPAFLNSDDNQEIIYRPGYKEEIGAYYLNGEPITSWGARLGASTLYNRKQNMNNWYIMQNIFTQLFPNGLQIKNIKDDEDILINKYSVLKLMPNNNGINLNCFVKFNIGDVEMFGKFINVMTDNNFVCSELAQYDITTQIKLKGKLYNLLKDWFKIKTGIYKCTQNEFIVYSELGELKLINIGNVIEVFNVDDNKIKFKFNDITYIIKNANYFWFNWFFDNINNSII